MYLDYCSHSQSIAAETQQHCQLPHPADNVYSVYSAYNTSIAPLQTMWHCFLMNNVTWALGHLGTNYSLSLTSAQTIWHQTALPWGWISSSVVYINLPTKRNLSHCNIILRLLCGGINPVAVLQTIIKVYVLGSSNQVLVMFLKGP